MLFGRRRMGKTHLSVELVRPFPLHKVWVYDPKRDPKLDAFPHFDLDNEPPQSDCVWLFDEFNMVCNPNRFERPWIKKGVTAGAHHNITVIANTQIPMDIHKSCRALATRVCIFRTTEHDHLQYMARNWGNEVWKARDLPPRKFLHIIP